MIDYKKSGVDIDKANSFIKSIIPLVKTVQTKGVLSDIGPFAGLYSIKGFKKFSDPVLVATTDGVGTKIKLCIATGKYWLAGYDLVAMNVNDIITQGAKPLFFLDYYAMSKLELSLGREIIKGIIRGCRDSGMSLLGGETAELPKFYKRGDFDLAGFALGIADRKELITGQKIRENDIIIGLPSSGPHSNGYSLIQKLFSSRDIKHKWGSALLKPTKIYVSNILGLLHRKINIKGMAHITGGGFYDNIARILPSYLDAWIEKGSWPLPQIFKEIKRRSGINDRKMYRTFNMGIGFVFLISENEFNRVRNFYDKTGLKFYIIGRIKKGGGKVNIN